METLLIFLASLSTVLWVGFALSPWGSWRNREVLDVTELSNDGVLREITVVIPARNEAEVIQETLQAVIDEGPELNIILVDDGSEDETIEKIGKAAKAGLSVIRSSPLPAGWSGKLWAVEQGRRLVTTPYTLLLDADIKLQRGVLTALREKMRRRDIPFISLMAVPSMASGWEKLLMPAFVYFFKILYPLQAVNSEHAKTAAAAGGCILAESRLLERIGGFAPIKGAVIDDCALAGRVKSQGVKIWLGLTHSATSVRGYRRLKEIWDMVARSAFFQLRYSVGRLLLCTLAMLLVYAIPVVTVASSNIIVRSLSLGALAIMFLTYLPILRFYRRSWAWALCLPFIAALFLAMTWTSAIRYLRGEQTRWKGRVYRRKDAAVEFSANEESKP